jgi:predicted nucleic acid-binding protein
VTFVDTSGWFSLLHRPEPSHAAAVGHYTAAARRVTHNYVLSELVPLATTRKVPREKTLAFAAEVIDSPRVEMVWVDEDLHREGMALLEARPDKTYSLCDAVSFVVMRRLGLTDALTSDKHFEQEGFARLLTA